MKKAFTLIELLVVVLIIGILSAVALPQYQVAVAKSRIGANLSVMRSIDSAQEVYRLANGQYANDFDLLDVQIPSTDRFWQYAPGGVVQSLYYGDTETGINLERYYGTDFFTCWAALSSGFQNKVCKAISGKSEGFSTSSSVGYNF